MHVSIQRKIAAKAWITIGRWIKITEFEYQGQRYIPKRQANNIVSLKTTSRSTDTVMAAMLLR
jgi:hypothetical protein